ncbi:sulfur carrier protein ThiS adenylyltransferase ThiF [Christensenella tenuis]|uniref:Sulfur carrier protein ThiS adenylyltransferase ThiF n=1 Tax=Christensenella tenuis TaxID=2763033 RepID=A0ABR7EDF8_9FIRM|nr:sulfur carrier protein ThiS adenylyltransferase ThiF [Christensenella tenuis]MBC5647812.1 sulfur carrier protein ThiS adenylyltransferase ThiF [Christensenella tenuis]
MKLWINGKEADVPWRNLYDAVRSPQDGGYTDQVVILNGYQTRENLPLSENDEIIVIRKGEMPGKDELEQMLRARHTPGVYEKIRHARVAIAGLGGLGSNIAVSLARMGVGHLHLIDFDEVEPSNLNRQQYRLCHLGLPKTEALQKEIAEINPFVCVRTDCVRLTEENAASILQDDMVICEAFDCPEAKAMLVNTVLAECPGKVVVAASGMAGYGSGNTIHTRKVMKNLYLCGDEETPAQPGRGLMAPRVMICAGHQANMVLRVLLGELDE